MKLLTQFDNEHAAREWAKCLRRKGIITHVSARYSSGHILLTNGSKIELWAILDNQYEDAIKLLNHEKLIVRHPLSEEQMSAMELNAKMGMSSLIDSFLLKCGMGMLVFILLAALLIGMWGI